MKQSNEHKCINKRIYHQVVLWERVFKPAKMIICLKMGG